MEDKDVSQYLFIIGGILLTISVILLHENLDLSFLISPVGSIFILLSTFLVYRKKKTFFSDTGFKLSIIGTIMSFIAVSFILDILSYLPFYIGITLVLLSYNLCVFQVINMRTIGIYILSAGYGILLIIDRIVNSLANQWWNEHESIQLEFRFFMFYVIIPVSMIVTLYFKHKWLTSDSRQNE